MKQIQIPDFFNDSQSIRWTICNNKHAALVIDKKGGIIYSEVPFKKYKSFYK